MVLCLYDAGTRLGGEVIEDLDRYFDGRRHASAPWADAKVFRTRIRRNIRLAECPSFGQSIFQYAPTSRGAEDYASLAGEIQGRPPASIWLTTEKRIVNSRIAWLLEWISSLSDTLSHWERVGVRVAPLERRA